VSDGTINWFDCDRCGRDVERIQYIGSDAWCSDCIHDYNTEHNAPCFSCGNGQCLKARRSWLQRFIGWFR
jgi:hypothetical protein